MHLHWKRILEALEGIQLSDNTAQPLFMRND